MRGRGSVYASIVAGLVLAATVAAADEVTSKGTVLKGKIVALSSAGLTLEPEYGKGELAIAWEDIEDVRSDGPFQVLYADGLEVDGALQGVSNGRLLVGADAASATAIELGDLHSAVPIGTAGLSWQDRMRSYWRYWDGSLDFGFNMQQATTDTNGLVIGFATTRTKEPTRLLLGANYRYGTQKQRGEKRQTIEDRAFGSARGEYDFTERLYGFLSGDATYDAIQKLSIRGVPKAGLGYTIWEEKLDETKRNFLAAEAGGAWVYEKFFTLTCHAGGVAIPGCDTENNFFAVAFGAAAGYYLPYDAYIGWRLDYLPAVDDFANDYLLRNALELSAPLIDPISAKFSLIDEYDNTPAKGTDHNSLYLAFGLSVGW